jgi:hypothetical protein
MSRLDKLLLSYVPKGPHKIISSYLVKTRIECGTLKECRFPTGRGYLKTNITKIIAESGLCVEIIFDDFSCFSDLIVGDEDREMHKLLLLQCYQQKNGVRHGDYFCFNHVNILKYCNYVNGINDKIDVFHRNKYYNGGYDSICEMKNNKPHGYKLSFESGSIYELIVYENGKRVRDKTVKYLRDLRINLESSAGKEICDKLIQQADAATEKSANIIEIINSTYLHKLNYLKDNSVNYLYI